MLAPKFTLVGTAAPTNVYQTAFEDAEGFDIDALSLVGQRGWVGTDVEASGLIESFLSPGQQAYVGFSPLPAGHDVLHVWRPIDLDPVPAATPVVTFSVDMAIIDSISSPVRNCFRWIVYNVQEEQLIVLDFDNTTLNINYGYDRPQFLNFTGQSFRRDALYRLAITMDFVANRWSAALNSSPLVPLKPISVSGRPLNLGDIDAVWVYGSAGAPGDNFMVFDNYRITAEPPPAPRLTNFGRAGGGPFFLRIEGEPDRLYAIEASTNLVAWTALRTNITNLEGQADFIDTTSPRPARRFYRARLVP